MHRERVKVYLLTFVYNADNNANSHADNNADNNNHAQL